MSVTISNVNLYVFVWNIFDELLFVCISFNQAAGVHNEHYLRRTRHTQTDQKKQITEDKRHFCDAKPLNFSPESRQTNTNKTDTKYTKLTQMHTYKRAMISDENRQREIEASAHINLRIPVCWQHPKGLYLEINERTIILNGIIYNRDTHTHRHRQTTNTNA